MDVYDRKLKKTNKENIFSTKALLLDKPNNNGFIYPKNLIEKSLNKINSMGMVNCDYNLDSLNIDLSKVSHIITNPRIENDFLIVDIKIIKKEILECVDNLKSNAVVFVKIVENKKINDISSIRVDLINE